MPSGISTFSTMRRHVRSFITRWRPIGVVAGTTKQCNIHSANAKELTVFAVKMSPRHRSHSLVALRTTQSKLSVFSTAESNHSPKHEDNAMLIRKRTQDKRSTHIPLRRHIIAIISSHISNRMCVVGRAQTYCGAQIGRKSVQPKRAQPPHSIYHIYAHLMGPGSL